MSDAVDSPTFKEEKKIALLLLAWVAFIPSICIITINRHTHKNSDSLIQIKHCSSLPDRASIAR